MKKLALSDEILLQVDKPARYIGNEVNMIVKDPKKVDIRFAMCFPDVYEIGMSHLGIQILYDMFNRREDTYCERVYSPWLDLDKIMREKDIPLFAIESQEPIKNFDFLGITLQYEMCYTNILQILDLSKIPLIATERGEDDPIVIGGGPCSYNPEPIANFFDMFYIGEGETQYDELLDIYKENKKNGGSRKEFLEKAAHLSCIYVPQFYDVTYNEDGTIKEFIPKFEELKIPVIAIEPETLDQFKETVKLIGKAVGKEEKANKLVNYYDDTISKVKELNKNLTEKQNVYLAGSDSVLKTCTSKMYQNYMFEVCGGENVTKELTDGYWTTISVEELVKKNS